LSVGSTSCVPNRRATAISNRARQPGRGWGTRVQPVEQLLQRIDVLDVGPCELVDAGHDRLVVVDHRRGGVREAEQLAPLGVEDVLFGLGVSYEGAAQELEDAVAQRGALVVAEPWNLARGLADVLDVVEQVLVLLAKRLGGAHLSSLSDLCCCDSGTVQSPEREDRTADRRRHRGLVRVGGPWRTASGRAGPRPRHGGRPERIDRCDRAGSVVLRCDAR
jgi:hypothetical protein